MTPQKKPIGRRIALFALLLLLIVLALFMCGRKPGGEHYSWRGIAEKAKSLMRLARGKELPESTLRLGHNSVRDIQQQMVQLFVEIVNRRVEQ